MSKREFNFKNVSKSSNGEFSPRITKDINDRLTRYCKIKNINKTLFVRQCIVEKLDTCERDIYENMSKDELITLLLNK